jgi:hypothetical protein
MSLAREFAPFTLGASELFDLRKLLFLMVGAQGQSGLSRAVGLDA